MFMFHAAIYLGLLAFTAGLILYIWALRSQGAGTTLAKTLGMIIAVVSLLGIVCLGYYAIAYWHQGYFQKPTGMHMMQGDSMNSTKI